MLLAIFNIIVTAGAVIMGRKRRGSLESWTVENGKGSTFWELNSKA